MTNTDTAGATAPEADRQPCRAERRRRKPRPTVPEQRRVHAAMTLHAGERPSARPWIRVYRWLSDTDRAVPVQCVALAQSDERKARKARRRAVTAARRHNRGQRATGG